MLLGACKQAQSADDDCVCGPTGQPPADEQGRRCCPSLFCLALTTSLNCRSWLPRASPHSLDPRTNRALYFTWVDQLAGRCGGAMARQRPPRTMLADGHLQAQNKPETLPASTKQTRNPPSKHTTARPPSLLPRHLPRHAPAHPGAYTGGARRVQPPPAAAARQAARLTHAPDRRVPHSGSCTQGRPLQ
jgi:hypothetical protein